MLRALILCSNGELPGTPRKAKSCLHSAAVELGNSCLWSKRKVRALSSHPFLAPKEVLIFQECWTWQLTCLGLRPPYMIWVSHCTWGHPLSPWQALPPHRPQKTLSPHSCFFPHTNFFLMGREDGAAWYNCNLFWSLQDQSLFKELPLSSAACLSLAHSSLRWQTRLKITCRSSLVQFHVTCLPSPCIDGNKICIMGREKNGESIV